LPDGWGYSFTSAAFDVARCAVRRTTPWNSDHQTDPADEIFVPSEPPRQADSTVMLQRSTPPLARRIVLMTAALWFCLGYCGTGWLSSLPAQEPPAASAAAV